MKTMSMLHRSLHTLTIAALAASSLSAQGALSDPKASAAAVEAPALVSPHKADAAAVGTGGIVSILPDPTFEGDIVHIDPGPGSGIPVLMFKIALLDAPAVSWASAPSQIVLASGQRVLLEISDDRPHLVSWTGATQVELGYFHSRAEFRAGAPGVQLVEAQLTGLTGESLGVARLVIEVAGQPVLPDRLGAAGHAIKLVSDECQLSVQQVVPGITSTSIAVIRVCNTGSAAAMFTFELAMTAPAGKQWVATAPGSTGLLEPAQCTTVYVAFALLDTDGDSEPTSGHATLSIAGIGKQGVIDVLGGGHGPACLGELFDICYGCAKN